MREEKGIVMQRSSAESKLSKQQVGESPQRNYVSPYVTPLYPSNDAKLMSIKSFVYRNASPLDQRIGADSKVQLQKRYSQRGSNRGTQRVKHGDDEATDESLKLDIFEVFK